MRVAIYTGRVPATTFIERLIEGLAAEGVEVLLFGQVSGKLPYTAPNIRVLGWRGRHGRWWSLIKYLLLFCLRRPAELMRLWRQLESASFRHAGWLLAKYLPVLWHRPDVFHLQWAKSIDEWAWVQDFDMRLVLSLRGAHINYSPVADHQLAVSYQRHFPSVDGFHAVSQAIAHEAQRYNAPAPRIQVVYSGVPVDQFPFRPAKSQRKHLHIVSVGRPHWKKGYSYDIDACGLLLGALDFKYTIIGGLCEEHAYHVHDLGLDSCVTLTGPLSFNEVQDRIREADALLLPSVEEGIANVVLEAMALGTPVISTNCGGMAEVIEDGVNGVLVPPRDTRAMAEAILNFSKLSQEDRQAMASAARKTIEQKFHSRQMVRGMLELYKSVLGGTNGSTNDTNDTNDTNCLNANGSVTDVRDPR